MRNRVAKVFSLALIVTYFAYPIVVSWLIAIDGYSVLKLSFLVVAMPVWGLAWGFPVLSMSFIVALTGAVKRAFNMLLKYYPAAVLFGLIAVFGAVVGLSLGNVPKLILVDSYKLLLFPVLIICGYFVPMRYLIKTLFYITLFLCVCQIITSGIDFIRMHTLYVTGAYYEIVPACIMLSGSMCFRRSRNIIIWIIIVLAILAGLKRGVYVSFLFIVMYNMFFIRKCSVKIIAKYLIVAMVLVGLLSVIPGKYNLGTMVVNRISLTYSSSKGKTDSSTDSRIYEVVNSWQFMRSTTSMFAMRLLFTGMGSGATYVRTNRHVRVSPTSIGGNRIHTIHFTPM